MKLCIKLPTYGRPDRLLSLLPAYYRLLSGNVAFEVVVSCNSDDPTMNCDRIREALAAFPRLALCFGEFTGKIAAYNAHLDVCHDWDILMVTSDDMVPQVSGYDQVIVQRMGEQFPDTDGVLHFNDGFTRGELNTLPILGRRYFERFGYVYHPSYRSFWADNEYMEVARRLNRLAYFDEVIIRHEHYVNVGVQPDQLSRRNDIWFQSDAANYQEREARNFELPPSPDSAHQTGDSRSKAAEERDNLLAVVVEGAAADSDAARIQGICHEAGVLCLQAQTSPRSVSAQPSWAEFLAWAVDHCEARWLILLASGARLRPGSCAAIMAGILEFGESTTGCFWFAYQTGALTNARPGWHVCHDQFGATQVGGFALPREVAQQLSQAGRDAWTDGSADGTCVSRVVDHLRSQGRVCYAHDPPLLDAQISVVAAGLESDELLLSILIPTLVSRQEEFQRLTSKLAAQIRRCHLCQRVEILYFLDNKEHSVGQKRNALLDSARGRFVAFIDDDDDVDDEYLPVLCNVIEGHPEIDCIGFRGQMTWAGQSREPMIHSLVYKQHENVGGAFGFRVYLRPPNHLNPTRREIAQRYRFADVNFGEDTVRADQMARDGAFEREYFIGDRVLYYYLFEPSRGDTLRPVNCK